MIDVPVLLGLATAVPPYQVRQGDVRELVYALFREQYRGVERLMPVFDNTLIASRYFSQPLSWFEEQRTFVESTAAYIEMSVQLLHEASEQAIRQAGVERDDIALVVVASTTGIATPSLDAKLLQRLCLPQTTLRLPIWGLGCAGGVAGLARTKELVQSLPAGKHALFAVVELCSLTFQRNDVSKSNIIASSLFGDGAAAVVLGRPERSEVAHAEQMRQGHSAESTTRRQAQNAHKTLSLRASYSYIFDDSEDVMGWDVLETGLKVRFSRDIPTLIRETLPVLLADACVQWGIEREQIRHVVVHAGGAKVLQAYHDIGISAQHLESAYKVLHDFGNMSSASVLFALKEFLMRLDEAEEGFGVMMALGPGFSAEFLLFRVDVPRR